MGGKTEELLPLKVYAFTLSASVFMLQSGQDTLVAVFGNVDQPVVQLAFRDDFSHIQARKPPEVPCK